MEGSLSALGKAPRRVRRSEASSPFTLIMAFAVLAYLPVLTVGVRRLFGRGEAP